MMQHNYLAYPAQAYQVIPRTVTKKASDMKGLTKTTFKSKRIIGLTNQALIMIEHQILFKRVPIQMSGSSRR